MPDLRDPSFESSEVLDLTNVSLMQTATGLRFGRLSDGAVVVLVDAASLADSKTVVIPDNIWGSIIAHVSARGEAPGEWHKAMSFHNDLSTKIVVTAATQKLVEV